MENSERKFELQWQQAFEGAEALPPASAWLSIENSLANLENNSNKLRIVYYRRLAASLLLICTASVVTTYLIWKDSPAEVTVASQSSKAAVQPAEKASVSESNQANAISEKGNETGSGVTAGNDVAETSKAPITRTGMVAQLTPVDSSQTAMTEATGNNLTAIDSASVNIAQLEVQAPPQTQEARLTEEEEKALVRKLLGEEEDKTVVEKNTIHRPAWASIGLAGGSYNPDPSSSAMSMDRTLQASGPGGASSTSTPLKGPSTGSSYSVGLMVGKQLGPRWLIQTGLSYMTQRIDYESNVVLNAGTNFKAMGFADMMGASTASYSITNTYTINSATEFISLPVQVGYAFVDRRAGFVLHMGVSTDFFIRNQLSDASGTYGTYSQSGSDASFRSISWAGLGSAELSYRLADQYRLSLVPGVRYSFTNTVKEESGSSQPLIFDVGLRFRYIFK